VPAERDQIGTQGIDGQRNDSRSLGCIDQDKGPASMRELDDLADRLDRTRHVGGVADDDETRIGTQRAAHIVRIDCPIGPDRHARGGDTEHFECPQRSPHRIVLERGRHHVVTRAQQPLEREIERIGTAGREDDTPRISHTEERR
jgi:hypothetical protein